MSRIRSARRAPCLSALLVCGLVSLCFNPGRADAAPAKTMQSTPVHIKSTAARNDNRDPINIEAAKLDYFNKEQKLIYRGNVVAVRGDTTLKTPKLVVFLVPKEAGSAKGPPSSESEVRRMEASGPVTIISKDQIATGLSAIYEKAENRIYLNGNVTLSQGPNVTKGDHLVYDTTTGQAVVTGHVRSMFIPNNNNGNDEASKTSGKTAGKLDPQTR